MEKWQLIDPYPGAHIRTKVGEIHHHGIYIGNDEVVQFGLPSDAFTLKKDIVVMRSPLKDFLVGFIEVKVFSKQELKEKRSNEEIIACALSKLGEGNYNILKNNCEHFCNECIFGKKTSYQVEKVTNYIKKVLSE